MPRFAIEIRLVTGRYFAAGPGEQPEWPIHPARLVQALVSVHKECGGDKEEENALLWLEKQAPPAIYASGLNECLMSTCQTFVPKAYPSKETLEASEKPKDEQKKDLIKAFGNKGVRTNLSCAPKDPVVQFVWDVDPGKYLHGIQKMVARLSYIGRSSSFVLAKVVLDGVKEPTFVPDQDGAGQLRIPFEGLLRSCERVFESRKGPGGAISQMKPEMQWCSYSFCKDKPPGPFLRTRPMTVLEFTGHRPRLVYAAFVARQIRSCLMAVAAKYGPVPSVISGHEADGSPHAGNCHLQYIPMPVWGNNSKDKMAGIGILTPADNTAVRKTVAKVLNEWLQDAKIEIEGMPCSVSAASSYPPSSLRWLPYEGRGRRWATVSPVVLDRWPKSRRAGIQSHPEMIELVKKALKHSGVNEDPVSIRLAVDSYFTVPGCTDWPTLTVDGKPIMPRAAAGQHILPTTHVEVEFGSDISGPILVGKGRYQGLGLFRKV